MKSCIFFLAVIFCYAVSGITAENQAIFNAEENQQHTLLTSESLPVAGDVDGGLTHVRPKRTLFLKKKLLGAGLLGFGLGIAKGYKAGYHHGPEVHHVYVAPPVKYVEYVDKPVYVERIVEKPVYHAPPEYEPSWSPPEPSTSYGSW